MTSPRIVIIGGGIIGSLTARALCREGLTDVTVIERDPTYQFSSTALSAASIRTQFGCPVNVELSLYGAQFLKGVKAELGEDAEIGFVEGGYLILGDEATAPARRAALAMQRDLGADIADYDRVGTAAAFPWLATNDIAIATHGRANEGWFDAWGLLQAARRAAIASGARYLHAEVEGFLTLASALVV